MKGWIRAAALAFSLAGLGMGAAQAATPLPVEHFTRRPVMDDVVISPNGTRLAVLVFGESGKRILGVMDLDPVGKPRVVASFSDADVTSVAWINDDRLVLEAVQVEQGPEVPRWLRSTPPHLVAERQCDGRHDDRVAHPAVWMVRRPRRG
jgi:hypothetical protein